MHKSVAGETTRDMAVMIHVHRCENLPRESNRRGMRAA
jgi:hypothetical protein